MHTKAYKHQSVARTQNSKQQIIIIGSVVVYIGCWWWFRFIEMFNNSSSRIIIMVVIYGNSNRLNGMRVHVMGLICNPNNQSESECRWSLIYKFKISSR
ncbi:hypothetical protein LguiA_028951 [Lonicera macranthoides]